MVLKKQELRLIMMLCCLMIATTVRPASVALSKPTSQLSTAVFASLLSESKQPPLVRINKKISLKALNELAVFWAKIGKVNPEMARPGIQNDGKGGFFFWNQNPSLTKRQKNLSLHELELAALFRGYKHVARILPGVLRTFSSSHVFDQMLARYALTKITFVTPDSGEEIVVCSSAGRTNALVYVQLCLQNKLDCTKIGLLLGYSPEDICAFYQHASQTVYGTDLSLEEIKKRTEQGMVDARAAIVECASTVEEWIAKNAAH